MASAKIKQKNDQGTSCASDTSIIKLMNKQFYGEIKFCIVFNIPNEYHSKDLRNYFHYLIEREAFVCFHFRHRSQKFVIKNPGNDSESDKKANERCCALIAIQKRWINLLLDRFNNKFWPSNCTEDDLPYKCYIRLLAHENDLFDKNKTFSSKPKSNLTVQASSLLNHRSLRKFSKSLHKDPGIERLDFSKLKLSKLLTLIEFNPPAFMPRGNVGTPLSYFLTKISSCQLPQTIITKLELKFPRGRIKRNYSEVPYSYDDDHCASLKDESGKNFDELIRTENGHIISDNYSKMKAKKPRLEPDEEMIRINHFNGDDDDIWIDEEIQEDEHDNELIFEEEIDVTWDKGSSGLVFYTDAQFWKLVETSGNDFDALTADNFNIETDPEFFDKDMADLKKLCQKNDGLFLNCKKTEAIEESLSSPSSKNSSALKFPKLKDEQQFGYFEKYTKGFGRKILERYGWKKGQGLGLDKSGIVEPLNDFGQEPSDKRGFGYYGLK